MINMSKLTLNQRVQGSISLEPTLTRCLPPELTRRVAILVQDFGLLDLPDLLRCVQQRLLEIAAERKWAAVHRANAFIPQLGRVMPTQINVKAEAPKRVVYPSLDESRAALRARGIDPDIIERAMMPKFITDERPVIDGEVVENEKTGADDAS